MTVDDSHTDASNFIDIKNSESISGSGILTIPKSSMKFITEDNEEEISPVLKKHGKFKMKLIDNSTNDYLTDSKWEKNTQGFTYGRNIIEMDPIDEEESCSSKSQSNVGYSYKQISSN